MIENSTNKTIKCLPTDNGSEYISQEFEGYLKQHGIKQSSHAAAKWCCRKN